MNNSDIEQNILNWLEKGGYPLEMFAHRELSLQKFYTEKSPFYTDIESGKRRELDVVGEYSTSSEKDTYYFNLMLLVECKKSDKPILVICESGKTITAREALGLGRVYSTKNVNHTMVSQLMSEKNLLDEGPLLECIHSGYSILQAHAQSDETYRNKLYGLAKAEYVYEKEAEELFSSCKNNGDTLPIQLIVPILLVDAPLFSIYLNEANEVQIHEVSRATLSMNVPWFDKTETDRRSDIQIVTKTKFRECVAEFIEYSDWLDEGDVLDKVLEGHPIPGASA